VQLKGLVIGYRRMALMLYWFVYHLDLGLLGPKMLELAVKRWLKRTRKNVPTPVVRRQRFGGLTALHLEPNFGDEGM
jgi:hypothetical protein